MPARNAYQRELSGFIFRQQLRFRQDQPAGLPEVKAELLMTFAPSAIISGAAARWLSRWSRAARFSFTPSAARRARTLLQFRVEIKFEIRFRENIRADVAALHDQIAELEALALAFSSIRALSARRPRAGRPRWFPACGFPSPDNSRPPADDARSRLSTHSSAVFHWRHSGGDRFRHARPSFFAGNARPACDTSRRCPHKCSRAPWPRAWHWCSCRWRWCRQWL